MLIPDVIWPTLWIVFQHLKASLDRRLDVCYFAAVMLNPGRWHTYGTMVKGSDLRQQYTSLHTAGESTLERQHSAGLESSAWQGIASVNSQALL